MALKRSMRPSAVVCASYTGRPRVNPKSKRTRKKNNKNKAAKHYKRGHKSHNGRKNEPEKPSKLAVERCRYPCRRYEEFHDHFLNYDQILSFLTKIQKNHPGSVQLFNIGLSGQGKPIYMIFITTNSSHSSETKFAAFIEAGLKGEDTFAVSNALYIIDHLCKNPNFVKLMDYFIVPCGNPDAYDEFVKSRNTENNASGTKRTSSKENSGLCGKKTRLQASYSKRLKSREILDNGSAKSSKKLEKKTTHRDLREKQNAEDCNVTNSGETKQKLPIQMDLSTNFGVYLGANDMRNILTSTFLDKIKLWKENYVNSRPETVALVNAICSCQFAVKLLISLQEGGETICYPYGFCEGITEESNELKEVARKGKSGIVGRQFRYGSIYELRGLTYGSLVDFLKMDRIPIKYMYVMQVHQKTCRYDEKRELKELITYGCQIMESIKRMSTAVYKTYTNMTGNRNVETVCVKKQLKKKDFS